MRSGRACGSDTVFRELKATRRGLGLGTDSRPPEFFECVNLSRRLHIVRETLACGDAERCIEMEVQRLMHLHLLRPIPSIAVWFRSTVTIRMLVVCILNVKSDMYQYHNVGSHDAESCSEKTRKTHFIRLSSINTSRFVGKKSKSAKQDYGACSCGLL